MVILLSSPTYAQRPQNDLKPVLNVFLLAGQSNMAGADSEVAVPLGFEQTDADRGTLFTAAPLPDGEQSKQYVPWGEVRGHESKGKLVHGPEVGFARTLHAAGWRNLAIIKVHANFGRDVQDWPWSERGSLFDAWTSFADARIAELVAKGHTVRVRGFLWHQGIDDAIHGKLASHYERNLSDLISVLRKRYADEHAPFLLARSVNSRIAQPDPNAGDHSPMAVVRRSQVNVGKSVSFAAWIDVDDLPNVNTHHFSADSQLVIGKRFGEAFLKFRKHAVEVSVTSPLPEGNVPMDPAIDCGQVIREHGGSGVLDPNSLEVINLATGKPVPFARSEDFAYGDRGRLEWVVTDPTHTKFEVRFRSVAERPALEPQEYTPLIGVGDLLRYNAGQPRPFALPFPARLVDLTGDGKLDLVGCWNYAYRPGWPWSGIVCYPRVGDPERFEFGDLARIRYVTERESTDFRHFMGISMMADVDFVDFDSDGLVDLVWRTGGRLNLYQNTGRRDAGGMPVFVEAGSVAIGAGGPVRAFDLDGDGAPDVIVGDQWLRNTNVGGFPPTFAPPVRLSVSGVQCWFDVNQNGKLDAIIREDVSGGPPDNVWALADRIAWRPNLGGDPPEFGAAEPLAAINAHAAKPNYVAAANDGGKRGLLVTDWPNLTASFYQQIGPGRFRPPVVAQSMSAVISLGDQAWPHLCDWNGNGVLDLLVGGGYGWPQIVINEGTNERPAWAKPQYILAEGKPIRITRNEVLGGDHDHDMGYPYPAYVDWDGDGLPDLVVPNETNRIFWYQNIGTRQAPKFGPRQQVLCDGYPDSPEARLLSAKRAAENLATEHATGKRYPAEADQPFFWRTGAAFADFNGDGLMDMVTYDGATRVATLFVQSRGEGGKLRLKKQGPLATSDGKPIGAYGHPGQLTKRFQAVDWDGDGLLDLIHSTAGTWTAGAGRYSIGGVPGGTSIHLLRNVGTKSEPKFESPRPMLAFGEPIAMTHHGPHAWAGDLDGDGKADLVTCVEWSVYPFYSHNALEMPQRPSFTTTTRVTNNTQEESDTQEISDAKQQDPESKPVEKRAKRTIQVKLSEPVVVAQAPPELNRAGGGWGRWQFPFLRRLADGRLHVSFSVEPDAASSYGKPVAHAYSADEGQSWRIGPPLVEHEAADGVLLPSGDRLQPVQRPSRRAEEFDLPNSVCDFVCSFRFPRSLYRADELPAELSEWRFRRLPAGKMEWVEELATMRIPDQLRSVIQEDARGASPGVGGIEQVTSGVLPTPFLWGKMRVAPDKSLWAVTYHWRLQDGKPQYAPQFLRSIDQGRSWDVLGEIHYQGDEQVDSKAAKRDGFTEPDYNFRPDGSIICVMRTSDGHGHGPLYLTRSVDGAKTWSRPVAFDRSFDGGKMPQLLTLACGVTLVSYGQSGGPRHIAVRATADPAGLDWQPSVQAGFSPPFAGAWNSCGHTEMVALDDQTALMVYSDFSYPDKNGVQRKSILTRRIQVVVTNP